MSFHFRKDSNIFTYLLPEFIMSQIVSIRLRPHTFKYLKAKLGQPYRLSLHDDLGHLIWAAIMAGKMPDDSGKLTQEFRVILPNHLHLTGDPHKVQTDLDRIVDGIFRQNLFDHLIIFGGGDRQYKDLMLEFLDYYDISEDELSLDTLYRDFMRKKRKYATMLQRR